MIQGGQGRMPEDTKADAYAFGVCMALAAIVALWAYLSGGQ